jgi:hypothetical protein
MLDQGWKQAGMCKAFLQANVLSSWYGMSLTFKEIYIRQCHSVHMNTLLRLTEVKKTWILLLIFDFGPNWSTHSSTLHKTWGSDPLLDSIKSCVWKTDWSRLFFQITELFISQCWLSTTGSSCFMPGLCSWKMLCKSNTKFPFKTMYFLGVRGLITLAYTVHDYTTSGHTDL